MIFRRSGWRAFAILCLGAACALAAQSCAGNGDCGDGTDNDGDGFVDSDDPGCEFNGDVEAPDPQFGACGDAVDNDGDGKIDLQDPGCDDTADTDEYNEPIASCRDGIDNDGDGHVDFPNDPGCLVSLDDDEADDCPDGTTCPACSDGQDDDEDGKSDYPDDLGCNSAADDDEFNADPSICGANVSLQPLPADGVVTGFLDPAESNELISFECGGAGSETVYILDVDQPIALVASTDFAETDFDTVLYLRSECRETDAELTCNDDVGEGTASSMSVDALEPGEYYLVVDSRTSGVGGSYKLQVDRYVAQGTACDPADPSVECAPGYVCRLATPAATGETCELPQCGDDADYDGDGGNGYPDDPGCEDLADNDESDTCPGGPGCPECGDDVDNADPEDSLVDFPNDLGCTSASDPSEQDCTDTDPLIVLTQNVTTGTTTGKTDNSDPSCTSFSNSPEVAHQLVVPGNLVSLTVDTNGTDALPGGFDSMLYIKQGSCTAADLECDDQGGTSGDDAAFTLSNVAAGVYFIFVDGWSSNSGDYTLRVHGVIETGQPCNAAQITSGLFSCQNGGSCTSGTCQ